MLRILGLLRLVSKFQNLLLNKTEIGQFLNIKNKLGIPNKTVTNMKLEKMLEIGSDILSNIVPVRAVSATVVTIVKKPLGKSLSQLSSLPSLLRKVLSFTKVVFEKVRTRKGTPIIVSQNTTEARYGKSLVCGFVPTIANAMLNPKLIPNQNTRFQTLSLFSHLGLFLEDAEFLLNQLGWFLQNVLKSSMVNTYNLWFQIYRIIISNLYKFFKQILSLMLVVSWVACGNSAVALADDKVNQQYNEQDLSSLIASAEIEHNIPSGLLFAIAKTESGMKAYALNIGGRAVFLPSISKAQEVLEDKLSSGLTNIDVGVMQVNYRWHSHEFDSLEEMLTPASNISYAAKLLKSLYVQHGTWHKAVRYYHSANSEHHRKYSRKVVMCWLNS